MTERAAHRLLVVGWDAADWIVLDRLLAAGRMPHLKRLLARGSRAELGTLEPKLSPLLWTSIATGTTADKHGILNFVEPRPDGEGLRLASSTSRKCRALWNILHQRGLTTVVVGWYATHPAEPIRGAVVSNLLQEGEPSDPSGPWPIVDGCVHPGPLAADVAALRQRSRRFPREVLAKLLPDLERIPQSDQRPATLAKLMASATSVERAALHLLAGGRTAEPWDAAFVFFDAIDTTGHHFMQYRPPRMAHVDEKDLRRYGDVMDRVYEWHDAALGRLLDAAGPNATTILVSDHGFHSDALRPTLVDLPPERRAELESSWHRPKGIIAMAGPGVRIGATLASPTILDVAPTALALLGLPAGEDFDGRVLAEALTTRPPTRIPSWEAVEGDAGLHPSDLRQDPFEARDALQQLVDLGYMAALPEDVHGQIELVRRESLFNLGVQLMSRRRPHEAVPHFDRLVRERPAEPRYAICLGNCLVAIGRFADAADAMRCFLAHEPASIEGRMLRAIALAFAGDPASGAAIDDLSGLVARRDDLALAFGNVLHAAGRFEAAYARYDLAAKRDPRDPNAQAALARAALALGRFEAAGEHALEALDRSQAMPEAHCLLGAALAWLGDLDNAARSLDFARSHDPNGIDVHRWSAVVAAARGESASAIEFRRTADDLARHAGARPAEPPFGARAFAEARGLPAI
jgi:tetratricopeptide (TPR) repeat protein